MNHLCEQETERAHRRRKASTIHGWLVKIRGTLLGSERTRAAGIHEMREARAIRVYRKEHPEHHRGGQRRGGFFWIFPRRSRTRSRSHRDRRDHHDHRHDHHHNEERIHIQVGPRPSPYYGERNYGPCLHFHHRAKPYHHGHGTLMAGILLGRHHLKEKGRYLRERAHKERRRERRKRRRQRRDEALALKVDNTVNKHRWWRR